MRMTTLSKAALWQRIRALGMKSLGLLWLLWIGIQQSIHTTIQYALRHGADLGLPGNLADWSDTHALRAVMLRGHDAVGNLLLGDLARERFINAQAPVPISAAAKAVDYLRLAREAVRGELPGSSAGGEQPKFAA